MLIKYIKSVLWRVSKRLSYIEDAWCLKVKLSASDRLILQFVSRYKDNASIIFINSSCFDFMHFVVHIK